MKIFGPELELPFGKYLGKKLAEVADEDPSYLHWLSRSTDFGTDHSSAILAALNEADMRRIDAAPALNLTDHQQTRADRILTAIKAGEPVVRLEGGAGYGKSYVTKALAAALRRRRIEVQATAVSYVATQVLAEQLDPFGVECATLARTLHFTVRHEKGQELYEHSLPETQLAAEELLSSGHALIVDECSMINDRDANLLFQTVQRCGGHLILVGDAHQLPPVKQDHLSRCWTPLAEHCMAELTIPMRYNRNSHLFAIEQAARNEPTALAYGNHPVLAAPSKQLTLAKSIDQMMTYYCQYYREDRSAQHRMLLFRRRDVIRANNQIRNTLFGPDADIVEEDEQLMILRTGDTPFGSDEAVRYYSGQTYRVLEKWKADYTIPIGDNDFPIPHWMVRFDDGRPPIRVVFGINETQMDPSKYGGPEFQAAFAAARQFGLENDDWIAYRQLMSDFVRVAYQYATSVHRAQGQTLDYAYCVPASLMNARGLMGKALTYVALTRAKKHLTVL